MLKSINGWTFDETLPLADVVQRVANAGFQAFEPVIGETGSLRVDADEAECRRAADTIRGAGLAVASLACGLFWKWNYTSPAAADRTRARDITIALLDRAMWMDAGAILVVPGCVGDWTEKRPRIGYADALTFAADALHELARDAEARGIVIAIENVWNKFLLSPVEMRELVDRVNSPWVRVYLDTGNIVNFGYPQDWIDVLGRRIARVHVKDFRFEVGNLDGFCALGDGDVEWPAVMHALRRAGYDGPLTFEGPGDPADVSARIDRILTSV